MKKIVVSFILLIIPFFVYAQERQTVTLEKCVDGDTAWFSVGENKIKTRFLAIDTPESTIKKEEYGKEASDYTCNLLMNAKTIEIEYDKNSDQFDKYDRHLVWVFVNNELLQEKLVENGYAEVKYIYGDYKYTSLLEEKEKIAKEKKLHIWSNQSDDKEDDFIDKMINNPIIALFIVFIIIVLFIGNKKFRSKIIRKSKNYIKKEVKKKSRM